MLNRNYLLNLTSITYQTCALRRAGFVLPKLLCLTRIRTAFSGYRAIIALELLDLIDLEFGFCQNFSSNEFEISHSTDLCALLTVLLALSF